MFILLIRAREHAKGLDETTARWIVQGFTGTEIVQHVHRGSISYQNKGTAANAQKESNDGLLVGHCLILHDRSSKKPHLQGLLWG